MAFILFGIVHNIIIYTYITLVHMGVAQPCEKYNTFYYSYIRATNVYVNNKVPYDIGYI